MGFTMIYISGGGANGGRKNMHHEMMWPSGFRGPRGCVGVNGEKSGGGNSCFSVGVMATIGGKEDR